MTTTLLDLTPAARVARYRYRRAPVASRKVHGVEWTLVVDYTNAEGPELFIVGGPGLSFGGHRIDGTLESLGIDWIESDARTVNMSVATAALEQLVLGHYAREQAKVAEARKEAELRVANERAEFLRNLTEIRTRWLVDKRLSLEELTTLSEWAGDDYDLSTWYVMRKVTQMLETGVPT